MPGISPQDASPSPARDISDLVFVGLNSRVLALDRETGDLAWKWKSPRGRGFVTVLLDGDRLLAAVNGYLSAVDPLTGSTLWHNPLKGFGTGFTSVATVRGAALPLAVAALERERRSTAAANQHPSTPHP